MSRTHSDAFFASATAQELISELTTVVGIAVMEITEARPDDHPSKLHLDHKAAPRGHERKEEKTSAVAEGGGMVTGLGLMVIRAAF